MIGIFYTGLPRFQKETAKNHKDFLSLIGPHTVYDFTNIPRDDCPCNANFQSGNIQAWLFAKALPNISERYILKLRTDLWLTESSKNVILKELEKVISGDIDASFIGFSYKSSLDNCLKVSLGNGVADLVIIADREKINSPEEILEKNNLKTFKSGNWAFENIISDTNIANNVSCMMYIVRKQYDTPDEYAIGLDFMKSLPESKRHDAVEKFLKR